MIVFADRKVVSKLELKLLGREKRTATEQMFGCASTPVTAVAIVIETTRENHKIC